MMRVVMAGVLGVMMWASMAAADPALGLWKTEADKKGQTAHVSIHKCAQALCGKIIKIFNPAGQQISHKNVGRMIFWDVTPNGANSYAGRALVPAYNAEYNAEMRLKGNRLTVSGCKGPVCQKQTWSRVD